MAPRLAAETLSLSRSHGFRCVPPAEAGVEKVLLVVGETVGFDQIYSALRVNKAVVVFLREERLVNELVESGIWVLETFVLVSPLATPATGFTISNIQPFLSSESLTIKEFSWFGKFESGVTLVLLGCKNAALKHILSFRRQVYMFLNNPGGTLEASFRVVHGESLYVVYASTDSLRCFECGLIRHKRLACPLKECSETPETRDFDEAGPSRAAGANDMDSGEGTSAVATLEATRGEEVSEEVSEDVEQQAGQGEGEEVSVKAGLCAGGSGVPELESVAVDESQSGSLMSVEEGMDEEEDRLSEVSDIGSSQFSGERLCTVEQLNSFLDETKGRPVNNLCAILNEKAKGALVRTRFSSIQDMDAPTAFFFDLERSTSNHKSLVSLRKDDGTVTADPAEVRKMAVQFYSELYATGSLDQNCTKLLHNDLPQLDQQHKPAMDSALMFGEVTKAVYQLTSGRAPGIDDLSVDFYKAFWGVIREHLFRFCRPALSPRCFQGAVSMWSNLSCQRREISMFGL
ncbi:hypothetical protein SRHO_G00234620 [Serrasalmus rhombeus]